MGNVCCEQTADIESFITYCEKYASPEYTNWLKEASLSQVKSIKGSWGQSNQKTGKGVILTPNRLYYQGDIVDGVPSGKGKVIWTNHTMFIGDIEQSVANGQGEFTFTDSQVSLHGSWINGKVEINKKMVMKQKGIQKALVTLLKKEQFKMSQIEEKQLDNQDTLYVQLEFQGNTKYRGDVKLNKVNGYQINGNGKMTYADGSTYQGQFVDGKLQGQGNYSWPNGHRYQGNYKDNLRHGQGHYYYSPNKWVDGIWNAGIFTPRVQNSEDFKQSNRKDAGNTNEKEKESKIVHTENDYRPHD